MFTVEVVLGQQHPPLQPESPICDTGLSQTFWVDVVSDEVDCTSNSPTITVTFTNNSDTAIDLGFRTQLNAPAGSGGEFLVTQPQRVFLPAGGEETHTFSLKKNWTFNLNWSAATARHRDGVHSLWPVPKLPIRVSGLLSDVGLGVRTSR